MRTPRGLKPTMPRPTTISPPAMSTSPARTEPAGRFIKASMVEETSSRASGFAWTPAMLGDHTVVRGAFTVSSYMEGTGTNLRLTLNPPFTPAEINAIYNNLSLPLTNTTDGIARLRIGGILRCTGVRLLRAGVSARMGSRTCSQRLPMNGISPFSTSSDTILPSRSDTWGRRART